MIGIPGYGGEPQPTGTPTTPTSPTTTTTPTATPTGSTGSGSCTAQVDVNAWSGGYQATSPC